MGRLLTGLAFALALLLAPAAFAGEIYVVQGYAVGGRLDPNYDLLWSTDGFLSNRGGADARVRLLGVSNSTIAPVSPADLIVPAHRTAMLGRVGVSTTPHAEPAPVLWIVRLDVPPEVVVESVLFVGDRSVFTPLARPYRYGKTRLPVFRSLVPAGKEQVHLATFLGDPADIPSRINVAIYNGGTAAAVAHVEIRRQCDDAVVESRDIPVAPDTLLQAGGFTAQHAECGAGEGLAFGVYTVVTVDQPSVSFVSTVADNYSPVTSFAVTTAGAGTSPE